MNFKRVNILFLFLWSIIFSVHGQKCKSLLDDDLMIWTDQGYFGAIDLCRTFVGGQSLNLTGVNLAYIYKHKLAVGLAMYSMNGNIAVKNQLRDFDYGGVFAHWMIKPKELFFISGGVLAGLNYINSLSQDDKIFLFIEPEIKLWLNITSFMRISLMTAYRINKNPIHNFKTSGISHGLSILYGKF